MATRVDLYTFEYYGNLLPGETRSYITWNPADGVISASAWPLIPNFADEEPWLQCTVTTLAGLDGIWRWQLDVKNVGAGLAEAFGVAYTHAYWS